jgi:hypothetical protein
MQMQSPLVFEAEGKRYRLELQGVQEKAIDACEGCTFLKGRDCNFPIEQPPEIDNACTDDVYVVWREMK